MPTPASLPRTTTIRRLTEDKIRADVLRARRIAEVRAVRDRLHKQPGEKYATWDMRLGREVLADAWRYDGGEYVLYADRGMWWALYHHDRLVAEYAHQKFWRVDGQDVAASGVK